MTPRCALAVVLLIPAACVPTDRFERLPLTPATTDGITVDGSLDDWPDGVSAISDGRHVYLRYVPGDEVTLQAAPRTHRVWFDTDHDATTGARPDAAGGAFGADLEVVFSPPIDGDPPRVGNGVRITRHLPDGASVDIPHDEVGLLFAPTYASREFEIRLDAPKLVVRVCVERAGMPPTMHTAAGPMWAGARAHADRILQLPAHPAGTIRVLSYNVEFASPMADPEPFARLIRAINPDILLLQEWQDRDGTLTTEDVRSWFARALPECGTWDVITAAGWGVAVASCHPMRRFGPEDLRRPGDAPPDTHIPDRSIRFAGAIVSTPMGDVAAANVHLKCCGSANSPEDLARIAEADLINSVVYGELSVTPVALRIVAGDLNLVGSRLPLDLLRRGLDTDGSDLAIAPTPVLDERATYTWYDPGSRFTPGRLDYLVYSDATARVEQSFVVESERLSPGCLARSGLLASDSRASDHLPVVVDLRPVTNP